MSEPQEQPATMEAEMPPQAAEAPIETIDYEKAFNELFEHAQATERSKVELATERDDLASQLELYKAKLAEATAAHADASNSVVILTAQLEAAKASGEAAEAHGTELAAQLATWGRRQEQYKLWAARVDGDRADRMVLAESAQAAAEKVPGAIRVVLAGATIVW